MADVTEEETPALTKTDFKIFGKSISEIPCFRNSFICGIYTGVGGGLITFLMTSRAKLSSHVAFGSLWAGVFIYWIPCRYKYETTLKEKENWQNAIKELRKHKYEPEEVSNESAESNSSTKPAEGE